MKQVKIHCVDAHSHSTFMPEIIEEMSSFYDVQIDPENPDFLFCGNRKVLGDFYAGHFFYSRACKIHITEECVSPNFCFYDYALGSDHLDFGDRYVRCPEYYPSQIANIVKNWQEVSGDAIKDKKKFCNFIYSHVGVTWTPRQDFFHLLSQYKKIDAAGTLLRNTQDLAVLEKKMGQSGNNWLLNEGWSQHQLSDGSWTKLRYETKRAFIKDYKFTIAFENQSYPGYTTEKILDAFRARTVPIYWGNPRITGKTSCLALSLMSMILTHSKRWQQRSNALIRTIMPIWPCSIPIPSLRRTAAGITGGTSEQIFCGRSLVKNRRGPADRPKAFGGIMRSTLKI